MHSHKILLVQAILSEADDGWHALALSLVISLLHSLGSNYL